LKAHLFKASYKMKAPLTVILLVLSISNFAQTPPTADPLVGLRLLASGKIIHRFFDTSPVSPGGKMVALFRMPYENRSPRPGDQGEVVVIDLATGQEKVVATTSGWKAQLGANVQWGGTDEELLYNDVDTVLWKAYCVVLNTATGSKRRLEGTVFMASNDGKKLASYNLLSSPFAQVGYGVMVPASQRRHNIGPVNDDGIYITDVATGKCKRIVTIQDIYKNTQPAISISTPQDFEYYCFQVKWNPQGTRLLTTVQWAPIGGGNRRRVVITMKPDGSDLRTAVTAEQWARGGHHINWMPDGERVSMNLEVDDDPMLELISVKYDGTGMKTVFEPGSGHPSFHPKGLPLIVTDAYPNEPITAKNGTVPIRLLFTETGNEIPAATVYVSNQSGEFRIDPHPAWDRTGRYVVFNGFTNNTRCVYLIDLAKIVEETKPKKKQGNP